MGVSVGSKVVAVALALYFLCHFETVRAFGQSINYRIYDRSNTEWAAEDNSTSIVILKNSKNCLKCFTELQDFILTNDRTSTLYSLSFIDSSVFARKLEMTNINKLMPSIETNLFCYTGNKQNPFNDFNVDITPAILIIRNYKVHYIPYSDIFKGQNIDIQLMKIIKLNIEKL